MDTQEHSTRQDLGLWVALVLGLVALAATSPGLPAAGAATPPPDPTPIPAARPVLLPDLAIGSMTSRVEPEPGDSTRVHLTIDFTVVNQGTAPAESVEVYLLQGDQRWAQITFPEIPAGSSRAFSFGGFVQTGLFATWTLIVDPNNRIRERTKDNNSRSLAVSTRGSLLSGNRLLKPN
jgi:subtilase family serine protease